MVEYLGRRERDLGVVDINLMEGLTNWKCCFMSLLIIEAKTSFDFHIPILLGG